MARTAASRARNAAISPISFSGRGWLFGNWIADFVYLRHHLEWGVVTYTFHPFVIGRGHRMLALEKLVRTLRGNGAVFLTAEEAALEFAARQPAG